MINVSQESSLETPVRTFSEIEIQSFVTEYKNGLSSGSDQLVFNSPFEIKNETLHFFLNTQLMFEKFGELKFNFAEFLKNKTGNQNWLLKAEIKLVETEIKAYKAQDKYELMVEQNPYLAKFKEEFNLELNF